MENSEYEMLKKSTENNIQNSSRVATNEVKVENGTGLKGTVSLVLGIISLILCHLWFVSIPTGVIAIVLGAKSNRKGNKSKKGKAGMILGIVGLSLMLAAYGLFFIYILLYEYM